MNWETRIGLVIGLLASIFFLMALFSADVYGVAGVCNLSEPYNRCSEGIMIDTPDTTTAWKWVCLGTDGDSDASCSVTRPSNWVAGGQRNPVICPEVFRPDEGFGCVSGQFKPNSLIINGSKAQFTCVSEDTRLAEFNCSVEKDNPLNFLEPICGTDDSNTCYIGKVTNTNVLNRSWRCGNITAFAEVPEGAEPIPITLTDEVTCKKNPLQPVMDPRVPAINGTIGTARTIFSCDYGYVTGAVVSGERRDWFCKGYAGGTTAGFVRVYTNNDQGGFTGVCGTTLNTCSSGISRPTVGSYSNLSYWSCDAPANSYQNIPSQCQIGVRVLPVTNGSCGSSVGACFSGTSSGVIGRDSVLGEQWRCSGENGGRTVICYRANITANGRCGSAVDVCDAGILVVRENSVTDHLWTCRGTSGGNDTNCSRPLLPDYTVGLCPENISGMSVNTCLNGTVSQTDTETFRGTTNVSWVCRGISGGASASCSLIYEAQAVCGDSQFSCVVGTYTNTAISGTIASWDCVADGGNASCSSDIINTLTTPTETTPNNFNNANSRATRCKVIAFWAGDFPTTGQVFVSVIVMFFILMGLGGFFGGSLGAGLGGFLSFIISGFFGCIPAGFLVLFIVGGLIIVGGWLFFRRGSG